MSPPKRERGLRRIAADLASLHPDDLASVMAGVSPESRQSIDRLLDEFGATGGRVPRTAKAAAFDTTRVSPWLVQIADSKRSNSAMTAHGRQALHDCMAQLFPLPHIAQRDGSAGDSHGARARTLK